MMQEVQQALSECVEINTADLDEDVANSFFDEDARLDATVFIDPTLTVNGKQVRLTQLSPVLDLASFSRNLFPMSVLDSIPDNRYVGINCKQSYCNCIHRFCRQQAGLPLYLSFFSYSCYLYNRPRTFGIVHSWSHWSARSGCAGRRFLNLHSR